jgi:hypothetical protein
MASLNSFVLLLSLLSLSTHLLFSIGNLLPPNRHVHLPRSNLFQAQFGLLSPRCLLLSFLLASEQLLLDLSHTLHHFECTLGVLLKTIERDRELFAVVSF